MSKRRTYYSNKKQVRVFGKNVPKVRTASKATVENEQLLRTLTEKSLVGIYVVQDRRFRFVNANAASYAGYRVEEMVGKKADMVVHPDDRTLVGENARAMLKGERTSPYEFRIVSKKGHLRWVLETVTSIMYDGKPAILGNLMDITERKVAEKRLRESEQRLADIIDFLPDATFAIDRSGKVIAWNRAIEEMTGVKAKNMLGKGDYEYAIPFYGKRRPLIIDLMLKQDKKVERQYSILEKQRNLLIAEVEIPNLRGKRVFLWGKASLLYDSKGKVVGAIESIRDITERKQAEEVLKNREQELKVKNVQLEDLNAALRVLLKQREGDRSDLEETILANVKRLIVPFLEKLKIEPMNAKVRAYLDTLDSNLRDIISPFAHRISSKYVNLTNREIQIASLIKEGRSTKEIAELLNLSESAINIHRFNIRRKLGLSKKHNLQVYLSSLA